MNSFYISAHTGNSVQLTPEESKHCIRVLRLKKGDRVQLMNGRGSIFEAVIGVADPRSCLLEIVREDLFPNPHSYRLTIAIAPTKNMDRFEWFVEKATEIGVDCIVPLLCKNSERKEVKLERLEKIVISAMKQSGQTYLPELEKLTPIGEVLNRQFEGDKLIAHCVPGEKLLLKNAVGTGRDVLLLIGPEGDFDPSEIDLALGKGFVPVSLGHSRLRTETAGIVGCHAVCMVNE